MSIILGIHDGHTATACLTKDGEIVAMVSEERFNRVKNWGGTPTVSAKWCLEHAGIKPSQLDTIAVPGLVNPLTTVEHGDQFPPGPVARWSHLIPQSLLASDLVLGLYLSLLKPRRDFSGVRELMQEWQLPAEKLQVHEHHLCHAGSAYHLSGLASDAEDTLVFTLDGSGDGLSGTVSVARGAKIERKLALSSYHSLGLIYSLLTRYLGMKALEHEYKVMGLAPYAPEKLAAKA
ncbi:MAG: carbamoyltransferase N-terminal domain-containing protein, partial [Roseimicrobium sp.]